MRPAVQCKQHPGNSICRDRTLLVLISKLEVFGAKICDASEEMVDESDEVDGFEKISEPKGRF